MIFSFIEEEMNDAYSINLAFGIDRINVSREAVR